MIESVPGILKKPLSVGSMTALSMRCAAVSSDLTVAGGTYVATPAGGTGVGVAGSIFDGGAGLAWSAERSASSALIRASSCLTASLRSDSSSARAGGA